MMSTLLFPEDLLYHPEHTWLRLNEDGGASVGITDFAQEQLGEVAFVDLPAPGAEFAVGAEFGTVESIKAVSGLFMPVSGKVTAVNENLADEPSLVNSSPYEDGWMLQISLAPDTDREHLLKAASYRMLVD
jgi:glycine cleavage system H protein